eukprot:TRINITY_DN11583_c0_g1_i1.p1 TRINITY_DN11583_c0_g1~~TRINITY_DN11583_c0_g1_i1.p1  ORF type:complete len:387 (-),score=76.87 TRINITY_DN11583_c0_g1_i1:23-1183(-)
MVFPLIKDEEIKYLYNHEHNSVDNSILYRFVLSKIYKMIANLIPSFISPNFVTFSGGFFVILAFCLTWYFNPNFFDWEARYIPLFGALGMFLYQLCDGLDGVVARKTGMCSCFGDFVDHSVDAWVFAIAPIFIISALKISNPYLIVAAIITAESASYTCQLEAKYTGKIELAVINGCNEGIALLYVLLFACSIIGAAPFQTCVFTTSILWSELLTYILVTILAFQTIVQIISLFIKAKMSFTFFFEIFAIIFTFIAGILFVYLYELKHVNSKVYFVIIVGFLLCLQSTTVVTQRLLGRNGQLWHHLYISVLLPIVGFILRKFPENEELIMLVFVSFVMIYNFVYSLYHLLMFSKKTNVPLIAAFNPEELKRLNAVDADEKKESIEN